MRILGFLVAILAAASARAQPVDDGDGVNRIHIENFAGRLELFLIDESREPSFDIAGAAALVEVANDNRALSIHGQRPASKIDLDKELNWRLYKDLALERYLDAYPVVTIRARSGAAIIIDNSIAIVSIAGGAGDITVDGGYLRLEADGAESAHIALASDSDIALGAVRGDLYVKIGGAGAVRASSAGAAQLLAGGSGDIAIGAVAGDAVIRASGSGDVTAGDIGGALTASVSGSGDVSAGAVTGGADLSAAGSGDIDLKSIAGAVTASLAGNGDIVIEDGVCDRLNVALIGSGDFDFGGVSNTLHATVNGPGAISVARNDGPLVTSGSGVVRVGYGDPHE